MKVTITYPSGKQEVREVTEITVQSGSTLLLTEIPNRFQFTRFDPADNVRIEVTP